MNYIQAFIWAVSPQLTARDIYVPR
jgi:hypothetical protein